ncbi:MAG: signal recognition particle receptor subunit alpha, partial [Synergistaceae bacterium]|nr:signal recognition particle receptor subunit alpha [Synergistaceae bacterium]
MAFFNFSLKSIKDGLNNIKEKWGISKLFAGKNKIDESFWTELEEKLILGDVGVDYSEEIIDYLRAESKKIKDIDTEKLREIFVDKLSAELEAVPGMGEEFDINNNKPYVLLMIGVNGSGKTTSAGKLAWQYKNAGKDVILAAGDTFRAAAVEQIKIWGERTGVRVIAQEQGSDAASVAFDAWRAANNSNADVLIVDTA